MRHPQSSVRGLFRVFDSSTADEKEEIVEAPAYGLGQSQYDLEQPHINGKGTERRQSLYKDRQAGYEHEDVFGDEGDSDVKYRTLAWWQCSMIMIAETISLGILSLPSAIGTLGLAPGIIIIAGMGIIATYTGYTIGQFKMAYPFVHSMADAGEILFRPLGLASFGREFLGAAQVIFLIFSMGSHVLTWSIMLNTVTDHATCTIVWSVIGFIVFWIFDLPRTLKMVSFFSIVSFISIISACLITMIDVGITVPYTGPIKATASPAFSTAFNSVANIVFAYAGHVAFFGFISEMSTPTDWPKALFLLQACDISMYITVAIVIFYYSGPDVLSPAFGSAGYHIRKIAWGIAIPTIVIAGVIYGHVVTKYVYVRMFRGTKHMHQKTFLSVGTWAAIALTAWLIAWVIAESIPDFNDLLSLISALFASYFTFALSGIFWLFLNYGQWFSSPKKIFLTIVNWGIFFMGVAICGIGLYSSGKAIHDENSSDSWTCKNTGQT